MEESPKIIATLGNLFKREGLIPEYEVISLGKCSIEISGYDNWNGGTDIYGIFCKVPLDIYSKYEYEIQSIELSIKNKAEKIFRAYSDSWIGEVVVSPQLSNEIHGKIYKVPTDTLLSLLEQQKSIMISVSTGEAKIQNVNNDYESRAQQITSGLEERNITNTNSFSDLWAWYGKWSDGSLPKYQPRRVYISEMFELLFTLIKNLEQKGINPVFEEPTGWVRVDRSVGEIKQRLVQSETEEQFQGIGLLSRETLISLAQVVFVEDTHKIIDGTKVSKTDAKRMLEAYIAHTLSGSSNENIRRHARASLDLANDLTHRRTASFRQAALCAESTNAVVNIIAIISGRRDPR
jgi:hypothetical protein